MAEDLRAVLEDTNDKSTLIAWLRLASTRGADEVAAAIRASRASERSAESESSTARV
jgi:hypothetical protein